MKQLKALSLLVSAAGLSVATHAAKTNDGMKYFSIACRNTPKPPVQNWQSEGKRRKPRIK